MNHTLGGDSEVLSIQLFLVKGNNEIIRPKRVRLNRLSIAVQELNWGVISVLGKERDRLLSSKDLHE